MKFRRMRSVCFKQSSITKVHQPLNPCIVDYTVDIQQAVNCSARDSRKVEGAASRLDTFFKIYQRIAFRFKLACNFKFSIFPGNKTVWAFDYKFP